MVMSYWDSRLLLIEPFMVKAGKNVWYRCFHGTIKREIDSGGNPVVIGRIKVGDGFVLAKAEDQWELGDILDELFYWSWITIFTETKGLSPALVRIFSL